MWLHLPTESSNFAPEPECSESALKWRYRALARSATLRGKPLPPRSWYRAWKRATWLRRLSGLTLPHSTLDAGVERWIASCRAIPASQTALPESEAAPTMIGSSSNKSFGSSMKAGLVVCSARTSRGTPTGNLPPSSRHWSDWVAALRSEYGARPTLALPTGASDCSSWPTANARVKGGGEYHDVEKIKARHAAGRQKNLSEVAQLAQKEWRTPATHDPGITTERLLDRDGQPWTPGQRAYDRETGRMAQTGLTQQAEQWATPQARDHFPPHTPERIAAMKAEGHGMRNLNDEAAHWNTPTARDYKDGEKPRLRDGEHQTDTLGRQVLTSSSHLGRTTPAGPQSSGTRRVLNPQFVEWLMGWPVGFTRF